MYLYLFTRTNGLPNHRNWWLSDVIELMRKWPQRSLMSSTFITHPLSCFVPPSLIFHFLSFTCFPSSLVPSVQELRKLCSNSCLNKHDDNHLSTLQICVFIDMFPITWYACNEQGEPNCRASQLYEAGGCKKYYKEEKYSMKKEKI